MAVYSLLYIVTLYLLLPDKCSYPFPSELERLQEKGIKTFLLSGDRKEAVANVGKMVGIEDESIKASLTPQQKSSIISSLQAEGHHVAMVILCIW